MLKEKSIRLISNFEVDNTWLPQILMNDSRMLILYRHLIKHYLKFDHTDKEYNNTTSGFSYFLNINYDDNSTFEILKDQLLNFDTPVNIPNKYVSVNCSSELSSKYVKNNLLDYDLNSAWAEGSEGSGIEEWLEINVTEQMKINEIILFPGYGKSEDLFYANNRVKKVSVEWNGKSKIVELEDYFCAQSININDTTNKIKITFLDVYKGSKYNDLCVSEIMLTKPQNDKN